LRNLIMLATAAAALLVAGCNTFEGMGKDLQAAGSAVSSTADDVKR
jgi:predicted small secreted protein